MLMREGGVLITESSLIRLNHTWSSSTNFNYLCYYCFSFSKEYQLPGSGISIMYARVVQEDSTLGSTV